MIAHSVSPSPTTGDISALVETSVHFAEKLRKQAIGEPEWIPVKCVFEYSDQSPKVVALLKLMRMTEGVVAFNLLRSHGLFVDMGAILRCVHDCEAEIYFLLEEHPAASPNVKKFTKAFFEHTIDSYLDVETEPVPAKKIRAAMTRVLRGQHDHATVETLQRVHKTFCGYVHAGYAHIMETYGGGPKPSFNLMGVPSLVERQKRLEVAELAARSVMYSTAFIAHCLGLEDLRREIYAACFTDTTAVAERPVGPDS
jgi:hypothetical protein